MSSEMVGCASSTKAHNGVEMEREKEVGAFFERATERGTLCASRFLVSDECWTMTSN